MTSKAFIGETEWRWDGSRSAWVTIRNGREEVIKDNGVDVIGALISTSKAKRWKDDANGAGVYFSVNSVLWENNNGRLTATTARGWFVSVVETPVGYIVHAEGYGRDMTYFPKSPLREALYDAAQWADTLWAQTLRDENGRIWKWDEEEEVYRLIIGAAVFEIGYSGGSWYVTESDRFRLIRYDNPIQAANSIRKSE